MKNLIICLSLLMAVSCVQEADVPDVNDSGNIFRKDSSANFRITSALLDSTTSKNTPENIVSSRWDKDYIRGTVSFSLSLE
jgi:hypothetical protein